MKNSARVCVVVGMLLLVRQSLAEEKKLYSGPQPGEAVSAFTVLQIKSPDVTKKIQLRPDKKGTALIAFMHKPNEQAIDLLMSLEWYAHKQKGVETQFVLLHEDKSKAEEMTKRWSRRPFFASALWNISEDGIEGPGRYGLNREMILTVLISKDGKVVNNFAFTQPNNTDAPKILEALAKAVDQPAPSYDKIRAELLAERKRKRAKRSTQNPVYKLAPNAELGRLMLSLVYRERPSEAAAKDASESLSKWAGSNKDKQAALAKYSKAVLRGKFEINRYARAELEKLGGNDDKDDEK
jgi:hypothetical protein